MEQKLVRSNMDSHLFSWRANNGTFHKARVFKCEASICWIKPLEGPHRGQLCAASYDALSLDGSEEVSKTEPAQEPVQVPPVQEKANKEPEESRPIPIRERDGHFVVDLTNNRVWGGSIKGWIDIKKVSSVQSIAKIGNAYRSMNEFTGGQMPKWNGQFDPKGLKVFSATQVYQMAGLDFTPPQAATPAIPTNITLGLISNQDGIPEDVIEGKKREANLFNQLIELKRAKTLLQPRVQQAAKTLEENSKLDDQIDTIKQQLRTAQEISLSGLLGSIPGLRCSDESSLSSST